LAAVVLSLPATLAPLDKGKCASRIQTAASGGVYRPRNPRASLLCQCAMRHARELREAGRIRRAIERRVIHAATPVLDGTRLNTPPTPASFARFAPAELRRLGLGARRGATLVRLCRSVDLERLRSLPTAAAADRLERERGLGPWSVGVVCLEGLGRFERGVTGDLGLVKLCSARRGRRVEAWETAELLEPYGEWAGLARVYLLSAHRLGLVPIPQRAAA